MKVIVGLGNPGAKYEGTRHNVGFQVLEALAQNQKSNIKDQNYRLKFKIKTKWVRSKSGLFEYQWVKVNGEAVELVKPLTFMNSSGAAVKYLMKKHSELTLHDLYVVHDDLDIKLGEYKIQLGKGPKQHNGVESIESVLGVTDFWRVRVGIENRHQTPDARYQKISGEEYVLKPFLKDEREVIDEVMEKLVGQIVTRLMI